MTVSVELPEWLAARVAEVAAQRGLSAAEVVTELVAAQLADPAAGLLSRPRLAFAGIGASSTGRGAAEADEMLAEDFGRD
ncbi:MAG: hypothetical protein ACR2MO_03625 [Acidimicrobiales bacterium]